MNLYSINTIKQELLFSPLVYRIKKSDYSESLILTYNDIDNNPHQEALGTNRSILSNWLEILDYDTETKENLDKTFDLLLSSIGLFGIKPDMQKDKLINKIDNFIKDFDSKTFSDVASSVLDILKECFDPHPVLAYLYPHYYALLHSLYLYAEKSCSYEETVSQFSAKITVLLQELLHLKSSYEQAREYTQSVFIEPYTDNASVPSTTSAELYHSYCKILNKSNFYMDAFDFPINEDYLKNIFDNKKLAIIGLAFFAICPWHILKSRWGMDCNLFPDLILFAVLFLILGIKKKKVIWQILSFVMLGISSYSYATSYLFLPIFVGITLGYLIYKKEISIKRAVRIFRNCFCDFVATDCISYYKYF